MPYGRMSLAFHKHSRPRPAKCALQCHRCTHLTKINRAALQTAGHLALIVLNSHVWLNQLWILIIWIITRLMNYVIITFLLQYRRSISIQNIHVNSVGCDHRVPSGALSSGPTLFPEGMSMHGFRSQKIMQKDPTW